VLPKLSRITDHIWIFSLILFLTCLTVGSPPASGEYYRYYDENGVLRFTDNMAEVPVDQRPQVKRYGEEANRAPEQPAGEAEVQRRQDLQENSARESAPVRSADIQSAEDLRGVREELDEDYADLQRRREALQAERDTLTTPEEVRAYQQKVRELNESIQRFETRRQEFIQKAKEHNALVK